MCCHDSVPSPSPKIKDVEGSMYAETAPARATVDVFVSPATVGDPEIYRLFRVTIPPGQVATYYLRLVSA
jgi:hypothetical protein